jgi:hypothetical protein
LQGYLYGQPLAPGPLVKRIEELSAAVNQAKSAPAPRAIART